jgi:hypothetical protein
MMSQAEHYAAQCIDLPMHLQMLACQLLWMVHDYYKCKAQGTDMKRPHHCFYLWVG